MERATSSHSQQVAKRVVLLDDFESSGVRNLRIWGIGESGGGAAGPNRIVSPVLLGERKQTRQAEYS